LIAVNVHFGRTLAKLRKEKKVSQRETAEALSVSQALLSHYENGLREPGLAFLCRAADYFSCSTDYLLGRTLDKQGISLVLDMPGEEDPAENEKNRRTYLLANGFAMLSELLQESEDPTLFAQAYDYLSLIFCRLFRQLVTNSNVGETTLSALPPQMLDLAVRALASSLEFAISDRLRETPDLLAFDGDQMMERYPVRWESMLTLIKESDERLSRFIDL
jgi:transcriptional regulator with XRE-family HTH domain